MWKKIFLLVFLVAFIGKGFHLARDGFNIRKIAPIFPKDISSDCKFTEEARGALDQTYRYLAKGRQSYAFVSVDGQYVLKLPRFDRFRLPFSLRMHPFLKERRIAFLQEQEKRYRFLLNSFVIAEKDLKEETGILYLHIGETDFLKQDLEIVTQTGEHFSLPLDKTLFILQKRVPLMTPFLLGGEDAVQVFHSFLDCIAVRARKGIFNKDPTFLKNFGYDGSKVIQFDVGSFYRKGEGLEEDSFLGTVQLIQRWVEKEHPEFLVPLQEKVASLGF